MAAQVGDDEPRLILHADGRMERVGREATPEEIESANEALMRFVEALARLDADRDYEAARQRARGGIAARPE